MKELVKYYQRAEHSAKNHMKNGQINAYLNDLIIMDHYKNMIKSV